MRIKGFGETKGKYFIGRYVEYWKSGSYFHKKVHYIKCCKCPDGFYTIRQHEDLKYLGHNVEVVFQTPNLSCLAIEKHPVRWDDNEY